MKRVVVVLGLILLVVFVLTWLMDGLLNTNGKRSPQIPAQLDTPTLAEPFIEGSAQETVQGEALEESAEDDVDVFGVVWNEEGEPVAGASVVASQGERGVAEKKTPSVTLEDGTYALKGLRLNNPLPYKIVASADGYALTASMPFYFDKAPKEVEIILSRGSSIRGRVTTNEGEAIEGATLKLSDTAGVAYLSQIAETSAGGEYAFANVSPAEYNIHAQANYYSDEEKFLRVSPNDSEYEVDFDLDYYGGVFVKGKVIDKETGQPIRGAHVSCLQMLEEITGKNVEYSTYTPADGRFRLGGFYDGVPIEELWISKDGYDTKEIRPASFEIDYVIELKPLLQEDYELGWISGRVLDRASREPVNTFQVALLGGRGSIGPLSKESCIATKTFHSVDGSFLFSNLKESSYYLQISASGYATEVYKVSINQRDMTPEVEVTLGPGATVTGAVYDLYTRNPIPGVRISTGHMKNAGTLGRTTPAYGVLTDEQGFYRLTAVPVGSQYVLASHPDYALGISKEINTQAGEELSGVDLFLGQGGSVEGRIIDPFRKQKGVEIGFQPVDSSEFMSRIPIGRTGITLFPSSRRTLTDDNGYYRIDGLPEGYSLVWASIKTGNWLSSWYVSVAETVKIREGETTVFDIDICKGGTIEGAFFYDKSKMAGASQFTEFNVYLRDKNAPPIAEDESGLAIMKGLIAAATSNRSVRKMESPEPFSFKGVCPGEYTLTASIYEKQLEEGRSGRLRLSGAKTIYQESIPVVVREGETTEVRIDW
jgi:hypothetical protein